MTYPTRIDLCDGKYSVIYDLNTGQSECLRYGLKWRDLCGDKMVLAMFDEIVELRTQLAAIQKGGPALLPCPFCGGPVTLEEAHVQHHSQLGDRQFYGVVCRNTINLGGSCCMEQVPSATKDAAIFRWNMRNGVAP